MPDLDLAAGEGDRDPPPDLEPEADLDLDLDFDLDADFDRDLDRERDFDLAETAEPEREREPERDFERLDLEDAALLDRDREPVIFIPNWNLKNNKCPPPPLSCY